MKLTTICSLITVCMVMTSGIVAHAALAFGATPEWLAHKSAIVFEGTPQKVTVYHLIGARWITEVRFTVERRLKGPITEGDAITIRSIDYTGQTDQMKLGDAVPKKRKVLVMASIANHSFPETDGHYIFVRHDWNRPVIFSDEPAKYLYTETGSAIRDYADVVKRAEAQIAKESSLISRYWGGEIVQKQVDVPWESDAHKELYTMSAVLVVVLEYKEP